MGPTGAGLVHQLQVVDLNGLNSHTHTRVGTEECRTPRAGRHYLTQFSTFGAGIRLNSATLSVTQTASMARVRVRGDQQVVCTGTASTCFVSRRLPRFAAP